MLPERISSRWPKSQLNSTQVVRKNTWVPHIWCAKTQFNLNTINVYVWSSNSHEKSNSTVVLISFQDSELFCHVSHDWNI